jgi:hypothetical protein
MSRTPQGRKETIMALLDSAHGISAVRTRSKTPSKPLTEMQFHPAIFLCAGFGLIFGSALVVHMLFKILV